jgi:hypothetical protein
VVQGHLNFNLEDFERNYQHISNITVVCIVSPDIICSPFWFLPHRQGQKVHFSGAGTHTADSVTPGGWG